MPIPRGRAPTAMEFKTRYQTMLSFAEGERDNLPTVDMRASRPAYEWMRTLAGQLGENKLLQAFNTAIVLGTFRYFAERQRLTPFLVQPGARHFELPPMPPVSPAETDLAFPMRPGVQGWSSLVWMNNTHKTVERPQLLDEGIRILGGLALLPPTSAMGVRDAAGVLFVRPLPFTMPQGLDSYPHEMTLAPLPIAPPSETR